MRQLTSFVLAGLCGLSLVACKQEEKAALDPDAVARGSELAGDCKACHNLESEANMIGPHLRGIVGRNVASVDGFEYSQVLLEAEGVWDAARLQAFILDSLAYMPGTKMAYGGITEQEAKDIVTYLQSLNQ